MVFGKQRLRGFVTSPSTTDLIPADDFAPLGSILTARSLPARMQVLSAASPLTDRPSGSERAMQPSGEHYAGAPERPPTSTGREVLEWCAGLIIVSALVVTGLALPYM